MEVDVPATIECLPVEILENILQNDVVTCNDIVNFSSTCKRFRDVVDGSNKIWKKKFMQTWPSLTDIFDSQKAHNWRVEFMCRLHFGAFVQQRLCEFSAKYIELDEISESEFEDFKQKLESHMFSYFYVVDELKTIFKGDVNCNLTKKYYAVKLMRFLKQEHLRQVWQNFVTLPPDYQLLEVGAVFVAQWCQPLIDVSVTKVSNLFDRIAERVKLVVRSRNSCHPVLSVPPEKLDDWKSKNLIDNQFSISESKMILTALCEVLFQHYCFRPDNERYQFLETSLVNWAMENRTGTPLMTSIIVESIARRLGVKCEVVVFPSHLLLRWKEKYKFGPGQDSSNFSSYIDIFNQGQFLSKRSCPRYSPSGECPMKKTSVDAATAVEVVEHLATDILTAVRREGGHSGKSSRVRSGLELLILVNPSKPYNVLRAARFYADYNLDSEFLLDALDRLQHTVGDAERHQLQLFGHALRQLNLNKPLTPMKVVQKRNDGTVNYAVGLIMQHRHYRYRCVIFGWDHYCKATPEWILQMGVGNLEYKTGQPFYNVLVCDGSLRYAAQENLEVHPDPQWIEHPLIGRYFEAFCGTHYLPNEEKAHEYPDDEYVRTCCVTTLKQQMGTT